MNENSIIEARKRRRERKRKIKRFFTRLLALILIFAIGFASGMIYGRRTEKEETLQTDVTVNDTKPEEEKKPAENDKNKVENGKLEALKYEFVQTMSEKYPGVEFSFAIKNLDTGAYVVHNNRQMNSASLIKLFILETVYTEMAKGNYELTAEREKDLRIMITQSNNQAANNFIDDFGGDNEKRKVEETNTINKTIKAKGYKHTELNRKMHDTLPPGGPSGYQNYTSAEAVCTLLEGIYNKTLLKEPYNKDAFDFLKKQERRGKIPAKIVSKYNDVMVANKTGELSQVENDAAIIMGDGFNIVFVVLTDNIPYREDGSTDYPLKEKVQGTIADMGLKLVEFYKKNKF